MDNVTKNNHLKKTRRLLVVIAEWRKGYIVQQFDETEKRFVDAGVNPDWNVNTLYHTTNPNLGKPPSKLELQFLVNCFRKQDYWGGGFCYTYKQLSGNSNMDPGLTRRLTRALVRKGFLKHITMYDYEECRSHGSGFVLTTSGAELLSKSRL